MARLLNAVKRAFARGVFPYQFAWVLELPWRRLVLSPEVLSARLPLHLTADVLEIGSGSGYYSAALAGNVPRGNLRLLDLQHEMVSRSVAKCAARGLTNVSYAVGNAAALPFRDHQLDAVCMVTVLGEISDRDSAVRAVARVLRPGGILSVSEHLPDPDFVPFRKLRAEIEAAGFTLDARFGSALAYTANFRKNH